MRNSISVVPALLAAAVLLALASPAADAARRPASQTVAKAIKRVALRACGSPPGGCRYLGARISTRNPRYAWADVVGEGFSGVLLKRSSARSHRFRAIGTQGGGIGSCAYWRARAPLPVLRDLRVFGLLDASTGATGRCG